MGNQKQKWTSEEKEALRAGVAKHGTGKWKNILIDPEFATLLTHRSNIDLKDKWRNMGTSTGVQGSKDKYRISRVKAITAGPLSSARNSASAASIAEVDVMDESCKSPPDGKTAPRAKNREISGICAYLILDSRHLLPKRALSTIKDANGSDLGAIVIFIEQRHEVPQNFRRLLSSKLRRLVLQGKLEKIRNCYKIKETALGTKTPTPKQKDIRPRPSQKSGIIISSGTLEDAAMAAAYKIAEAENKSFVAAESVKEAERVSKMAEDAESVLQLVKNIYEQCSQGEIVLLA